MDGNNNVILLDEAFEETEQNQTLEKPTFSPTATLLEEEDDTDYELIEENTVEDMEVPPDPYVEPVTALPTTTYDDAFESLINAYAEEEETGTSILGLPRIEAEAAMVGGDDLTKAQLELLLPPTSDKEARVSRRAGMTLDELLTDLRLERYEEIDNKIGLTGEQLLADMQYKLENYTAITNQFKRKLDVVEKVHGKDSERYEKALAKYNYQMKEAKRVMEEGEGGTMFARTPREAELFASIDAEERVNRTFETAEYFLKNRNVALRELSRHVFVGVETGVIDIETFNGIMTADEIFDPVTAVAEVPHNWADMQEQLRQGNYKAAAFESLMAGLNLAAALPAAKLMSKGISSGWRKLSGGAGAYHDVQKAMANESRRAYQIKKQARAISKNNPEVRTQIIKEFEEQFDVKISVADKDGNLAVDPILVRESGKKKISDYFTDMGYVGNDGKTVKLTDYAINDESLAIPILDPDKMDMFVATVVGLKDNAKFAEALDTSDGGRLVDKLFDLTLNKDLLGSEELLAELTKNGLAFEEYVLGVVGSGSQAGKILNQLSQIKRVKPTSVREAQETKAKIESQKAFGKFWASTVLRTENVRRGLMVSSLATTMRNLQSGLIRAPMESLADIMDTSMLTYQQARATGQSTPKALLKFHNAVNPLVRDGTWSGSFNNLRYMFMDQARAEDFTKYILERPELTEQLERMFNNINEIQEYTGRGQATTKLGKGYDNVMSRTEDLVWAVNGPNRWQEHMIRRATFLSELERQVKVNWEMDLQTALKEGKIDDMLRDAPSVRPEGARSFQDMVETATNRALDVTYAKQPDFAPFKAISDTITKSGLTVVVPFPRFMFNSLEYMAQNTGGVGLVAFRKAMFKESRAAGITARDRQDITRNLVGLATMKTFYDMRQAGYSTEDYTMVSDGENQVDISAQFPLRQMAWITEFAAREQEGTLDTWYGMEMKEIAETFLGSTLRVGTSNVFVDEITDIISGTEDIIDEEKRSKTIGRLVGQYAATFLTPVYQLTEAQRAQGARTTEAKDFKGSIDRDSNLPYTEHASVRAFYEVFGQRGLAAPSFEEELPNRVRIDTGKMSRPDPASKLYAGLTITERDSDIADYLKEIGFSDATYQLGSKSRIPENKLAENEFISAVFPTMVEIVKDLAEGTHPDNTREQHLFARKEIRNVAEDLRNQFNDPQFGNASQTAIIIDELSRLNADDRRYGIVMFKKNNDGRLPDLTDLSDLLEYSEYSSISYMK